MTGVWAKLGFMIAGLVTCAQSTNAAVTETKAGGFVATHTANVAATPAQIWAQVLVPSKWWSKAHTWSGKSENLTLTTSPGGCFCETMPNSGFAEHARVIFVAPGSMLRLSGGLGPLQSEAVNGTLTISLQPTDNSQTKITFSYVVGGAAQYDLSAIGPAVDGVIGEQHSRLVQLIRNGSPD